MNLKITKAGNAIIGLIIYNSPIPIFLDSSFHIEIVLDKFGIFIGSYIPIIDLLLIFIYLSSIIYFLTMI